MIALASTNRQALLTAFFLPLVVAVLTLVGCATSGPPDKVPFGVEPTLAPVDLNDPIPAHVGIYFAPDMLKYRHRQAFMSSIIDLDVGYSSVRMFDEVMQKIFEKATVIGKLPPYDAPSIDLDGIIEPRLDYVSYRWGFDADTEDFAVAYVVTMYTADGRPISSWRIRGNKPGGSLAGDMADAAEEFVTGFRSSPETEGFREYLKNPDHRSTAFDSDIIQLRATALTDHETTKLFGFPFSQARMFAVDLRLANMGDSNLTVRGYGTRLLLSERDRVPNSFPRSLVSHLESVDYDVAASGAITSPLLGFLGGFAAHSSSVQQRRNLDAALDAKRIKDRALGAGKTAEGLAYFLLPTYIAKLSSAKISLWVVNEEAGTAALKQVAVENVDYTAPGYYTVRAYNRSSAVDQYIEALDSGSPRTRELALSDLQFLGLTDRRLYDRIEQEMLRNSENGKLDEMPTLALALSTSGDDRYLATFETIGSRYHDWTTRRAMENGAEDLRKYAIWQKIISERRNQDSSRPILFNGLENALLSDDWTLVAKAANFIRDRGISDESLLNVVETSLLDQCIQPSEDPKRVNALKSLTRTLAETNLYRYSPTIRRVAQNAADRSVAQRAAVLASHGYNVLTK